MNHQIALEIIEANREFLSNTSSMALSDLANIHKDFDDSTDEAIIMSLALNDCTASMRFHAHYDKAIQLSRDIIERFPNTEHIIFIARHMSIIGRCMAMTGDHQAAEEMLLRTLEMAENRLEPSDDSLQLRIDLLHDLAMNADVNRADTTTAMQYLAKGMKLLEGTPFENKKGLCLMGIGNLKYREGKLMEALPFYTKACEIFDGAYSYLNMGTAHANIALCYADMGQMEKAEENLKQAHELRIRTSNHDVIANSYYTLGRFYDMCNNSEQSYVNMLTCRDYSLKSANKKLYRDSLEWLEKISLKRNDAENAAMFREEAQKAATS
jgi:tetratricopeptide (TPR) repeat protein